MDAFGILNSPLDPQLPCKICAIRTVQLFYIEADSALSTRFNTWCADTPMGLARMAAVFNSAALTVEEKSGWYNGDRELRTGITCDEWIERALRAFMEQCPHRKFALAFAAHYPLVYYEDQPVDVSTDAVARDYDHLAMESMARTFATRNRIVVIGGVNAKGLAQCFGKDAQSVEANTSESMVARAAKMFPSRMTRLAVMWPQLQAVPAGILEATRRAADRILDFKQIKVLIIVPATKRAHDFEFAIMLHRWDNASTPSMQTIGFELINFVSNNKERYFATETSLQLSSTYGVGELCVRVVKDSFGMAIKVSNLRGKPRHGRCLRDKHWGTGHT